MYSDCVDGACKIFDMESDGGSIKLKLENEKLDQWEVTTLISPEV